MQIHRRQGKKRFPSRKCFLRELVQAGAQSKADFVPAAAVLVAACDVVEEADVPGVSR